MAEQLLRLSPHRDLQCYYFQPSAIAALSAAADTGFTFSGSWRQQWDWAVVEWNRDNTFEHPLLRYLPDFGTPSFNGITLSYVEQRTNCVPWNQTCSHPLSGLIFESGFRTGHHGTTFTLLGYPTMRWQRRDRSYQNASVTMTLTGTVSPGLRVGLAFMETFASAVGPSGAPIEQQYWYVPQPSDATLASVASGLANAINAGSQEIPSNGPGNRRCLYVPGKRFISR